jgi:hypothetical protein
MPHGKDNNKMTSPQEQRLLVIDTPGKFLYSFKRKKRLLLSLTFETADKTGSA